MSISNHQRSFVLVMLFSAVVFLSATLSIAQQNNQNESSPLKKQQPLLNENAVVDISPVESSHIVGTATLRSKHKQQTISHRRLMSVYEWFTQVTVCRKIGDTYYTETWFGFFWWIMTYIRYYQGVIGSCDQVCPCGENGVCLSVTEQGYECGCVDGYVYDGTTCIPDDDDNGYEFCGGIAGIPCASGYICIDDPDDSCNPINDGADCGGICVPTCSSNAPCPRSDLQCIDGGYCVPRAEPFFPYCQGDNNIECPQGYACVEGNLFPCGPGEDNACIGSCAYICSSSSDCPDDLYCVNDPRDDCGFGDCPGVCVDVPKTCGGASQVKCPLGHVCIYEETSNCNYLDNQSCEGVCALDCGGFRAFPVVCPDGMKCVDNPSDGCDPPFAADCPGICVPDDDTPTCGGFPPVQCPDGLICVDDTSDNCVNGAGGADCPGLCVEIPSSCTLYGDECPLGYTCTDNPEKDCDLTDPQCSGICALKCGGRVINPVSCPSGFDCVDNKYTCSQAVDCQGICIENNEVACGGSDDVECPDGLFCVNDPRDECGFGDCPGVCVDVPSSCGGVNQVECPLGHVCVDKEGSGCNILDDQDCEGECALDCGGFRAFPVVCPDGMKCVDNPSDGCDPPFIADCPGVCVPDDNSCGGFPPVPCPDGLICVDDTSDNCVPGAGGADCPGICVEIPSSCTLYGNECPLGYTCADDPEKECGLADPYVACSGRCVLECGGFTPNPVFCPNGFECVDNKYTCSQADDCKGICIEDDKVACGGPESIECPEGLVCVDDTSDACDPQFGDTDCDGVCVTVPDSCTDSGNECPSGYTCTDNVESTCRMSSNPTCLGICALACGGFVINPVECPNGFACVDNPNSCSQAVDCQGVCIPEGTNECGGITGKNCDSGLVCIDDPDDNCDPKSGDLNCNGLCVDVANNGLSCGGSNPSTCLVNQVCVDDPDTCNPNSGDVNCSARCHQICGGPSGLACPSGEFCMDNPLDGCYVGIDPHCEGICRKVLVHTVFCAGSPYTYCPVGLFCFDQPNDGCNSWEGDTGCGGYCE